MSEDIQLWNATCAAAANDGVARTAVLSDSFGGEGDPSAGDGYILTSIAAVVLGGVSFYGGRGSALGSIAGAFILTILTNVLFFAGIDPLYQSFFEGLFLFVAVLLGSALGYLLRRRT